MLQFLRRDILVVPRSTCQYRSKIVKYISARRIILLSQVVHSIASESEKQTHIENASTFSRGCMPNTKVWSSIIDIIRIRYYRVSLKIIVRTCENAICYIHIYICIYLYMLFCAERNMCVWYRVRRPGAVVLLSIYLLYFRRTEGVYKCQGDEKVFGYRQEYILSAFQTAMNFIPVLAVG